MAPSFAQVLNKEYLPIIRQMSVALSWNKISRIGDTKSKKKLVLESQYISYCVI